MNGLSRQEKDVAILEAFKMSSTSWNNEKGVWMATTAVAEALSDFERPKQQFPVVHPMTFKFYQNDG